MGYMLELNDIRKDYIIGDVKVEAVKGVNLKIASGEFVAIMGASGSGKSTLMNIIGCLDKPTSGSYYLDGNDMSNMHPDQYAYIRNKKIGFVFQGFNLLSRTTALENVELPLLYNGEIKKKDIKEKAIEALIKVGLKDRIHHEPNKLSGGQQQRVAIARALINNPSLIVADEPTGNLDSKTSVEIISIFQNLNDQGITVILVTHEHDIALYAKRVITMKDGLLLEDKLIDQTRVNIINRG